MSNGFRFSARSIERLKGVHPDLVRVVYRALELTTVDFAVLEGLRTVERQRQLVASGASQTMASRHLNGFAVDLGAVIGGEVRWDWPLYNHIARAMQQASKDEDVPVRWGGCWAELHLIDDPEQAVAEYSATRRAQGRRPFLDGPHYELPHERYPG